MQYGTFPGLNITAAQQATSGHKGILTGQKLHSPVMLTGQADSHSRTKSQILTCKSYIFFVFVKIQSHLIIEERRISSLFSIFGPVRKRDLTELKIHWPAIVSSYSPKTILNPDFSKIENEGM